MASELPTTNCTVPTSTSRWKRITSPEHRLDPRTSVPKWRFRSREPGKTINTNMLKCYNDNCNDQIIGIPCPVYFRWQLQLIDLIAVLTCGTERGHAPAQRICRNTASTTRRQFVLSISDDRFFRQGFLQLGQHWKKANSNQLKRFLHQFILVCSIDKKNGARWETRAWRFYCTNSLNRRISSTFNRYYFLNCLIAKHNIPATSEIRCSRASWWANISRSVKLPLINISVPWRRKMLQYSIFHKD